MDLEPAGNAQRQIVRLEALAEWLQQLAGMHQSSATPVAAIDASSARAPAAIRPQVRTLAARLRMGVDPAHAYRQFPDQLADGAVDDVVLLFRSDPHQHPSHPRPGAQRLSEPVGSVAIAPDGTWLATGDGDGDGDGLVLIWDRASGTCTATLTGHTEYVQSVAIAPDGTWPATTSADTVRTWDRRFAAQIPSQPSSTDSVMAVAIAPDGTWPATGGNDQTDRIWDRAWGTCTATLTGHTGAVRSVAIAPDGAWPATTSNDRTLRIWEIAQARTVAVARSEGALYSCVWAEGSHELAVGGERDVYLFGLLT